MATSPEAATSKQGSKVDHDSLTTKLDDEEPLTSMRVDQTLPKVKNVVAYRNPENPSRQIIVEWDELEDQVDFHYEVYIKADKKTETQKVYRPDVKACFSFLRSETWYTAYVWTATTHNCMSEESVSEPVQTDKAKKSPGFEIATDGKPTITKCISAYNKNEKTMKDQFEWITPFLGLEENNYKLLATEPSFLNSKNEQIPYDMEEDTPNRAKPKDIKFGTTNKFVVKSTYLDIDRNTSMEATATSTFIAGGDMAVVNVVANKYADSPRRELIVKWEAPKQTPSEYQVKLYKIKGDGNKKRKKKISLEPTKFSYKFMELRSNYLYICQVYPIYKHGRERGTISNEVKTDEKQSFPFENAENFGMVLKFNLSNEVNSEQKPITMISWEHVKTGENYKFLKYHLKVVHHIGFINKLEIFNKEFTETEQEIPRLHSGGKFIFKITTSLKDIDTKKLVSKTKEHTHYADVDSTVIHGCKYKSGLVTFSWEQVNGADKYRLWIKDDTLSNVIKDILVNKSTETFETTESLRVGKICMAKVAVLGTNSTSETDWKALLIGGPLVPKNVTATLNSENPERSVRVQFEKPEQGQPTEYKIVIDPREGKKKTKILHTTAETIEYLRKGVEYRFIVYAKHGRDWSDGAESAYVQTKAGKQQPPVMAINSASGTNFDMKGAQLRQGNMTIVEQQKGDAFGKVRDLKDVLTPHEMGVDKDILKLHWKVPSFDNNDYKVEQYEIEIRQINSDKYIKDHVKFQNKERKEYSTVGIELDLGETYEISVSTTYIDVDRDKEHTSSATKKTVQTRPCEPSNVRPKVLKKKNEGKDALKIEWNATKGADHYEVEIYTDDLEKPTLKDVEKETCWERQFDNEFGYGTSYHAVITAIGSDKKKNSHKTSPATIGGNFAPKRVRATIDHEKVTDRNTMVYLNWEPPEKRPDSYEIAAEDVKEFDPILCKESAKLITGLKAGVDYTFKVVAIDEKNKKRSGASVSNTVQTNPTPTQVKNVHTSSNGVNPSTSIKINWGKVNAEKPNESTEYKVIIMTLDGKVRNEINVTDEQVIADGLQPGTKYFTTVAGGNSDGFGEISEKKYFETALGKPKNVQLLNSEKVSNTSLLLRFSEAEGKPTKYVAVISKYEKQGRHDDKEYDDVKSGQAITDLESNTNYTASVCAVFNDEIRGEFETSEETQTAPSKPEIEKHGYCIVGAVNSSKKIFLMWKPNGCREHEVKIMHSGEIENQLIVNDRNDLTYFCLCEASRYTAQIRSKNKTFGPWSKSVIIELAPAKLKNVEARLDENSNKISIRCQKVSSSLLTYFCQPFCGEKIEQEAAHLQPGDDKKTVDFTFTPALFAEKYRFELWAENTSKVKGKATFSEYVISRPAVGKLIKVARVENKNLSTNIEISWQKLDRCDEYEIKIKKSGQKQFENCVRANGLSCTYRCQHPGSKYHVKVRGICSSIRGSWSEKIDVTLAPSKVELIEDRDEQDPVDKVHLKWKKLDPEPHGYRVTLYQAEQNIKEEMTENTSHVFEDVFKPGLLYYCAVAAYNEAGDGESTKSLNYRKRWNIPTSLEVEHDENKPTRRAKIFWNKPDGVNCFRLEIENNQSGTVIPVELAKTSYIFESGIPGNSYLIRLYSGCDGRYDVCCVEQRMIMKPEPPANIIAIANSEVRGIIVTIERKTDQQVSYEVCVRQLTEREDQKRVIPTTQERVMIKDLVPGASYEVSVATVCGNERSNTTTLDEFIQTFPAAVNNLVTEVQGSFILCEWDPLEIPPDKYIVQWGVNGELAAEEAIEKTKIRRRLQKGAQFYELSVAASNKAGKGQVTRSETFVPVPEVVKKLHSKQEDGVIVYEWEALEAVPDKYVVQWRVNNEAITKESTKENKFEIRFLKPAQSYNLRVMASNIAGNGEMTSWNTFITKPLPPKNITVISDEKAPKTSFYVKYEDDVDPLKEYRVTAVAVDGDVEAASVITKDLSAHITGLGHGRAYYFKVQTIFCGKERSEELFYNEV